jgi:DNA-binding response OmpR family regulator
MKTTRILIIEDEESILMPLADDLALEGYEVATAQDGLQGLSLAKDGRHDLIILDIMLPTLNGFEVCKQLRQAGVRTPVLMLTAKSQEIDKVLGLELGADDYVTKPFSPRELLARVKALLRRAGISQDPIDPFRFGDAEVDFRKCEVRKRGQLVSLTAREFRLLGLLVKRQGEVLSRTEILDAVWGEEVYVLPKTVDTHMAHLRKKIEDDPTNPKHLIGVRGLGYKFMG